MKKWLAGIGMLLLAPTIAIGQGANATLDAAARAMGVTDLTSIYFSGSGSSYNLGQAINASLPWPRFVLREYVGEVNFATPMMRQLMNRTNPDGSAPFGGVRQLQLVSGTSAWNIGANDAVAPAPATVAERQAQIWLTPPGFIKAARANRATVRTEGSNRIVTFSTPSRHRLTGTINAQDLVERIETALDNPVLGDMPVEVTFANYQSFGEVRFPTRIVQKQGGHPVLELDVTMVRANVAPAIEVPAAVRDAQPPPVQVQSQKLADGIWYLTGGTHHSVLVEFADHVVVVEGPLNEERSNAVIAEVRKLVPGKPIRYVVNTHVHFDHSGGLRTFVAEGATIVTPAGNKAYFEKTFAAPKSLVPDKLAQARRTAKVEGVAGQRMLADASRTLELHVVPATAHADEMLLAYLPKEKILVEADAYTPGAANAPPPVTPNPLSVELYTHIQRLKLDVSQIAALHGPRLVTLADLRAAIGRPAGD